MKQTTARRVADPRCTTGGIRQNPFLNMDEQDAQDETSPGQRSGHLCNAFILYILYIHVKKSWPSIGCNCRAALSQPKSGRECSGLRNHRKRLRGFGNWV